ncbi:MAG TPA: AAA family ATPase [Candidatus Limnocylindrales bacterium]|nr:AAA family ATPase [Candidatus Limnocylindrales bacterium]
MTEMTLDDVAVRSTGVLDEVERAVVGKRPELELILLAILADGHILVEDYPGLAKTLVARSFAQVLDLGFARIQFTPDLLPADVTGSSVYRQADATFEFRPGPVFTNLLLADEINRAPPKTQSALLEAMAERQVTVDGTTRALPDPFLLLATENPIEHEGTFPLPEAQLDRFFLKTALGYPGADDELQIIREQRHGHPLKHLQPAITIEELRALHDAVEEIYVDELIEHWIVALVRATRELDTVAIGASVRGSLALERAVRAWSLLHGRAYATPEDVERLFLPVLGHRIIFTPLFLAETRAEGYEHALERFCQACLEAAPRPEQGDAELVLLEQP